MDVRLGARSARRRPGRARSPARAARARAGARRRGAPPRARRRAPGRRPIAGPIRNGWVVGLSAEADVDRGHRARRAGCREPEPRRGDEEVGEPRGAGRGAVDEHEAAGAEARQRSSRRPPPRRRPRRRRRRRSRPRSSIRAPAPAVSGWPAATAPFIAPSLARSRLRRLVASRNEGGSNGSARRDPLPTPASARPPRAAEPGRDHGDPDLPGQAARRSWRRR